MKTLAAVAAVVPVLLAPKVLAQNQPAAEQADPATVSDIIAVPKADAPDAQPDNGAALKSPSRLMEEIVVTAQKREENIQDVPISIAAFGAEQLDARGIVTTKDLGQVTPGLQFTELAGYTLIYLRGVGTDSFIASCDPSIATYVDGIYVPAGHGLAQALGAVERVEVLKGPQGTLFGRNSTGGAISITTTTPDGRPESSVQLSYGNYNDLRARINSNIPLSDSLAMSVAAIYNHADSDYERVNAPPHPQIPSEITRGARIKLAWRPADDLTFTLAGLLTDQTGGGSLVSANTNPSLAGKLLGIQPQPLDYKANVDTDPFLAASNRTLYGQMTWQLPWFDMKLLGSNQYVNTRAIQTDFDGSPMPLVSFFSPHEYTDMQTGELQFVSNADSWNAESLKWVAGLYYLQSRAGFDPVLLQAANSVVQLPTGELLRLVPQSLLDLLPALPAPDSVTLYIRGLLDTRSYSAYAQATYTFTDWFDVTMGGRYQTEKRELLNSNVNLANTQGGLTTLIPFADQSAKSSNFSPKISLDFRVIEDSLIYLSASQGFKSGTYNIINLYVPSQYIKPEKVTSYELGIKSEWFNHNLRFNAAIFENDIQNLQTTFISLLSGGAVSLENAGRARIRGAEFDATWAFLPEADPGLVLTANAAYLDGIFTDFKNGSGFDEKTGLFYGPTSPLFPGRDFTGHHITRTPKISGNVGLSQTIYLDTGSLELAADVYYNSGFYFLASNSPNSRESAYTVANAHMSYKYDPWQLRLTVFGANLFGEKYRIAEFDTDFGRNDTLAPPLTYGLRMNWDF